MKARINGIDLAYSDDGRGLPVVFLHAFPFNRSMWEPQRQALSKHYRVIAVDLRGHGESDAPLWRYTLDQFADDVAGLLDHLKITGAVFVGLSMGGYLLFAFHRKYPERIKGLVFCDTRAEADTPEVVAWRFALAQRVYKEGAKAVVADMGPKLLSASAYQAKPDLVQRIATISLSTQISGIVGDLMAIAERPDSSQDLSDIDCPTLVLVGDGDVLTSPDENRRIAEGIKGARFEIIPSAGHLSNLEQPEAFNTALVSFLETVTIE
ncbi:MAG: alpha/beta fold hydrolase [Nitrospirae bacterium]|nr:alpha/beta fold hydrolase [Nitrospirota bacterium]